MEANKIQIEYSSFENQFQCIHENKSDGYITIASKNNHYKQRHYTATQILKEKENIIEESNAYISQNTFYKPQRRIENIRQLRALYIDLDCYKLGLSKDAVLYFLEKDFFNTKIPNPNLIIDSGQGMYLIWTIEIAPHQALSLWAAIQKYFHLQLKDFGADSLALDPTRILRVVGSINSKSNSMVHIMRKYEYIYTLREIQEEYLPVLQPSKNKKRNKSSNLSKKTNPSICKEQKQIAHFFNEYSLNHTRILDLIKLCELRNYDMDGCREYILFLYRYWSCCITQDPEEALDRAKELNNEFLKPLKTREVIYSTKSAEKAYLDKEKQYKYKNETLIELLKITPEEQKSLKTIIGKEEKYSRNNKRRCKKRRNENGLTQRQQDKINLQLQIKELLQQGEKTKEIAQRLNLSCRMILFHKKEIMQNIMVK